jgi:ATP-binding cassette subfamily F protein uup
MSHSLITLKDISLYYNQVPIFDEFNLALTKDQKIGFVGINGSGKTTMMKILANELEIDSGEILKSKGLKIAYLPQDFAIPKNQTIRQFLYPDINQTEEYLHYEEKIAKYLPMFGFSDLEQKLETLSGGLQRQVLILKAVASEPDLLLLDEPTNHLDLLTLENFKKLLQEYQGCFLLISHDRYFMDQVVNQIWELDNGRLFKHKGNYSDYLISKEDRYQMELKQHEKLRQELKRELEWVNSGVKARGTKDQGRLNRYWEIKEEYKNSKPKWHKPYLPLPKISPLGNKILKTKELEVYFPTNIPPTPLKVGEENDSLDVEVKNLHVSNSPLPRGGSEADGVVLEGQKQETKNKPLIKNLSLEFTEGMRVGLLGPNGCGKTTLIKTLLGDYKNKKGKIIYGQNTEFNYQDQKRMNLFENKSLMFNISENNLKMKFGTTTTNVYAYLKKFLFSSDDLQKTVSTLSGGQRARLLLAKILKKGGNFLILDEPTNDLDLDTLEALENSLLEFEGCSIIVSHDRFFLDRVCSHILAFEADGNHILSTGGYTDYLKKYGQTSSYYKQFADELEEKVESTNQKVKIENNDRVPPLGGQGGVPPLEGWQEKPDGVVNSPLGGAGGGKTNKDLKDLVDKYKTSEFIAEKEKSKGKKSKKDLRKEKVQQKELERKMEKLEKKIKKLELQLADPQIYSQGQAKINEVYSKVEESKKELEELEEIWLELGGGRK